MMIGVIDYGAGNLGSVMNALKKLGVKARFTADPEELLPSSSPFEKLIFPGNGHFEAAMVSLTKLGYDKAIKEWVQADKPFFGICIGLQLLFESSQEAVGVKGLSIIQGQVKRFPGRKIPQIGWNQTFAVNPEKKIFKGITDSSFFYYIHSYYVEPADDSIIIGEAEYYLRYCCAVRRGALTAVQFHPEKSGETGLRFLENWIH